MAHWDWAVATDGFLGAIVGGLVTGVALYFTIRHDHEARIDDRRHDAADRALAAASDLMSALVADAPNKDVVGSLVAFTHATLMLETRLSPVDTRVRTLFGDLTTEVNERIPSNIEAGAAFPHNARMHASFAVGAYTNAIRDWIFDAPALRQGDRLDAKARIRGLEEAAKPADEPGAPA